MSLPLDVLESPGQRWFIKNATDPDQERQSMATKAGVWIDHKQAILVLVTKTGQEIKKFKSGMVQSGRPAGSPLKHKHTPNDFIAEDRRERKLVAARKKIYDELIPFIRGAESVLILGPGEAKGELSKYITSKKLRGVAIELETADKMTGRQIAAKVNLHFAKRRASKPTAPTKTAKATSGIRTKKTEK